MSLCFETLQTANTLVIELTDNVVDVKSLVRRLPGNSAEITLNTPFMWISNRRDSPSDDPLFGEHDCTRASMG